MKIRNHIIAYLAVGCLLLVNALALPLVVQHSAKHQHHSATTHASPVCFWVCTAGQMEEADTHLPPQVFSSLGEIDSPTPHLISLQIVVISQARAPPFFL